MFKSYLFQVEAKINQMKALHEADLVRENERKRSLEGKWLLFYNMFFPQKSQWNFEIEDWNY